MPEVQWRSPDELVTIGFSRSRVVMMNEAHHGLLRCVRTREVGRAILPTAHKLGVRHLAMEALIPELVNQINVDRRLPDMELGLLSQPDMKAFIQAALNLGWTLVAYEDDFRIWLRERHGVSESVFSDPATFQAAIRPFESELLSLEYTNWREEQQARNLHTALLSLLEDAPLLVWCGNSHHHKVPVQEWKPMGYQFREVTGLDPFVIDQTYSVFAARNGLTSDPSMQYVSQLSEVGETAGFLREEAPPGVRVGPEVDALLLSVHNDLE